MKNDYSKEKLLLIIQELEDENAILKNNISKINNKSNRKKNFGKKILIKIIKHIRRK